jgi:hypothetical protein
VSTIGVVLISLLAGLLIALLIATGAYLAWMLHATRRLLVTVQSSSQSAAADISLLRESIGAILGKHQLAMESVVAKINGDKLVEAANVIARSAQRIETACVAFGELAKTMLSGEIIEPELQRAARSGLGPESYSPNPTGERFTSQSRTAAQDVRELFGESGEGYTGE